MYNLLKRKTLKVLSVFLVGLPVVLYFIFYVKQQLWVKEFTLD